MQNLLALDIGGMFIKYGLMDEEGNFIKKGKEPSHTESLEEELAGIKAILDGIEEEYEGIAVSMPGRIDPKKGIAYTGGAFRFIDHTPMASLIEEISGKPTVIANDGKCAARAEVENGALSPYDNGAVLVIGTGIGGGIVLNKRVWLGSTGGAGEFSFLPMSFSEFPENAQNFYINEKSVWTGSTAATGICMMYAEKAGLDWRDVNGVRIFEAYDKGEQAAIDTIEEFGHDTASGIYCIQSILDLDVYAIGGGMSARKEMTDVVRKYLDAIYTTIPVLPFKKPEIVTCVYGNDANLIGARGFYKDFYGK